MYTTWGIKHYLEINNNNYDDDDDDDDDNDDVCNDFVVVCVRQNEKQQTFTCLLAVRQVRCLPLTCRKYRPIR